MNENTQRPYGKDGSYGGYTGAEDAYWDGYYRGIKEASETWAAIVVDHLGDSPSECDYILDTATSELGKQGIDRTAKS